MPRSSLLDRLMRAQELNSDGFRKAPTSRKNPAFHRKAPTTKIEKLAQEIYGNE